MIWLLLDRTVHAGLAAALEDRGVRCIHAGTEELATADSRRLLEAAIEDDCILVTRNYADYRALASAFRAADRSFPGILFLRRTEPLAEVAGGIASWLEAGGAGRARDACVWLEEGAPAVTD